MNRHRKKSKGNRLRLRVYTHAEAMRALPYIASILRSMRDHRIEANRHQLIARRLSQRGGRPNRETILAHEHAVHEAQRAEEKFSEAEQELHRLDVYGLDVLAGLALIPFVHEDQLAWFVYDLFDGEALRFWRSQSDPLETRRPITDSIREAGDSRLVV
jgi:hypothetical protein